MPPQLVNALRVARADQIRLEELPYRYPMRTACTLEAEIRQIETCMAQGYPPLALQPLRQDTISIVGFGPSLHDTWREITHPCMTVSGTHDFLMERGITPDWHAECDGRDHKTKHLEHPTAATTYLMATICNPKMWEQLRGAKVLRWHNANGQHVVDWIEKHDSGGLLLAGGSIIGLTAIHLAGILGFRRFKIFGFDGNLRGEARHAGAHYGPQQKIITRRADGRDWPTTPQMSNATDEFLWLIRDAPIEVEVFGDSLLTAVLREGRYDFWWQAFGAIQPEWIAEAETVQAEAAGLRPKARYDTGSITTAAAVSLRALAECLKPAVTIEVGTFIGNSTRALAAASGHVYTCDRSNDCLAASERITPHPYQSSTDMLGTLAERGLKADLFFFDGRIQPPDLPLIVRLSKPATVYAFDDYMGKEKGKANVAMLQPYLKRHTLISPPMEVPGVEGDTSIALLLPPCA